MPFCEMRISAACFILVLAIAPLAAKEPLKGTLEDVEHIVIFMQENRAFDHCNPSVPLANQTHARA